MSRDQTLSLSISCVLALVYFHYYSIRYVVFLISSFLTLSRSGTLLFD